jgi:hypothetical protein
MKTLATKMPDEDPLGLEDRPGGQEFSRRDRLKFAAASLLATWIIRIIGSTLRWEVRGFEECHDDPVAAGRPPVAAFWHGRILASIYFWRNRGIAVMTSMNRDGEYIARVIRRFGFVPARGSSSRGGRRALVEMLRQLKSCREIVAFTVDGPRGPRYLAKQGAVWLAARLGHDIMPFNISLERKWVLPSWDRFEIPKLFSRAYLEVGPLIPVSKDASEEEMETARGTLQSTLDDLRERGDRHWQQG